MLKQTISHTFEHMHSDMRPQDPLLDGTGLVFKTLEHGGEFPDEMPQAILVTDEEGRSCTYVPVTVGGQVVRSHGYTHHATDSADMAAPEK